jgi:hypothetical protein
MPKPTPPRAERAPRRATSRRLLSILALTAVALPLVAIAPTPAGLSRSSEATLAATSDLDAGPTVDEALPAQVVTVVDGLDVRFAVTEATTVAEILQDLEVDRGPLDRVTPALHTAVDGPTFITLRRVEIVEEQVEVELPRELVRLEDPELLRGFARVDRPGRTGLRVDTQLVLLIDGEVESRLTVASEVVREPAQRVERLGTRTLSGDSVWDELARCEASGRWDAVRMIGGRVAYTGGLQFSTRTWLAFKTPGFPQLASEATREQQIEVAERVLARQGWGAWPSCSRRLGLR